MGLLDWIHDPVPEAVKSPIGTLADYFFEKGKDLAKPAGYDEMMARRQAEDARLADERKYAADQAGTEADRAENMRLRKESGQDVVEPGQRPVAEPGTQTSRQVDRTPQFTESGSRFYTNVGENPNLTPAGETSPFGTGAAAPGTGFRKIKIDRPGQVPLEVNIAPASQQDIAQAFNIAPRF